MRLVFATRPSALARWQTRWIIDALLRIRPDLECEEKVITTHGDSILDRTLPEIGGKGVFTRELESELLAGTVHCAVHSLKDLPVEEAVGLSIGCIPSRGEVRDVLVSARGCTLSDLPHAAAVGTSSLRRSAQLLAARPDLKTQSLRGNVDTRVRKAMEGQYDAIVLAGAGVTRLGLTPHVSQWFPLEVMLPAPGQGALAVQCRADDKETLRILRHLDDAPTRNAVTAERAFLSGLGGGCAVPVAAFAAPAKGSNPVIGLSGLVISPDGRDVVRVSGEHSDPAELGGQLARQALERGAARILNMASTRSLP